MWNLLKIIKKNLVIALPLSMVLGLLIGTQFNIQFFKSLITPLTLLMIFPMMINLDFKKLQTIQNKKLKFTSIILNFVFTPILSYLIGYVFFRDIISIRLGLLLIGLLPTSSMTVSWTSFSKGNVEAALKMMLIGLFIGSIFAPLLLKAFMGTSVTIKVSIMFRQIGIIIALPLILGIATKKLLLFVYSKSKYDQSIKPKFPLISTISVLLMVFVATALKAETIIRNPKMVVSMIFPLFIFYLTNYIVSIFLGKYFFSKEDTLALIFSTAMRNLSIALGIAMSVFKEYSTFMPLIISIAYVIQVQSATLIIKFPKLLNKETILEKKT